MLSNIWRGWGDKEAPTPAPTPAARPARARDPDPARPPHPGPAVGRRRESCSFPAPSAACGPGRISQVGARARRRGRRAHRGCRFPECKRGPAPTRVSFGGRGGSGGFQSPQPAGIGALGPAGSPGSEIWSFPGLESWRVALKRTRRERAQGASSLRLAGTGRWPPTE